MKLQKLNLTTKNELVVNIHSSIQFKTCLAKRFKKKFSGLQPGKNIFVKYMKLSKTATYHFPQIKQIELQKKREVSFKGQIPLHTTVQMPMKLTGRDQAPYFDQEHNFKTGSQAELKSSPLSLLKALECNRISLASVMCLFQKPVAIHSTEAD